MMRLHVRALAISAATVTAILATLCVLAVAIDAASVMSVAGYLTHLDLSSIPRPLTVTNAILGVIAWSISAGIVFGFAGRLYNWIASPK